MIDEIEQVAVRSRAPVLLMGPTGAGKSQLARRIFELKRVKHQVSGAFVEVNCATLKGDSAMSALFGHRKGAFTGAAADRSGLLRTADKGVLFLDEIGELGLDEQAMILRAIEEKRFLPVGGRQGSVLRIPAARRYEPRSRHRRCRGRVPRRPVRAPQPLDLRAAGASRPARGYRAQSRLRARPLRRAGRQSGELQQGGAPGLSGFRDRARRAVVR
jgi:hypothetical protein